MTRWNKAKKAVLGLAGLSAMALGTLPSQAQAQNAPQVAERDTTIELQTQAQPIINSPYNIEVQEQLRDYISKNNRELLRNMQDSTAQKPTSPGYNWTKPTGDGPLINSLEVSYQGLEERVHARMPTTKNEDLFRSHDGVPLQASMLLNKQGRLVLPENGTNIHIYTPKNVKITNAIKTELDDRNMYTIQANNVSHHWIKQHDEHGKRTESNPLFLIGADTNQRELAELYKENRQLDSFIETKDQTISILQDSLRNTQKSETKPEDDTKQTSRDTVTTTPATNNYVVRLRWSGTPQEGEFAEEFAKNTTARVPVERTGNQFSAEIQGSSGKFNGLVTASYFQGEQIDDFANAQVPRGSIDYDAVVSDVEVSKLNGQLTRDVLGGPFAIGGQAAITSETITPRDKRFGTDETTSMYGINAGVQGNSYVATLGVGKAQRTRTHLKKGGSVKEFDGWGETLRVRADLGLSNKFSAGISFDGAQLRLGGEEYDLKEKTADMSATLNYAISNNVDLVGGVHGMYHSRTHQDKNDQRSGLGATVGINARF